MRIQVLETQLNVLQVKKEELGKENSNMIESFCKTQEELRNENIDLVNKVNRLHKICNDASPEIMRLTDLLACCKEDNENYKSSQEKLILELQTVKAKLTGKLSSLTINKVSEIQYTRELDTQNKDVAKELTIVKDIITSVPEDVGDSEACG
ncbi:uncharacterized protein LOC117105843 [Anneissia japonica]|uniref:uncharacterized protein LOC117105843 n=1 Tax=Anneissia japonica TaxID=1529436 RepID=UPI0014254F16|nr:uncharacterized protein LOC117105843 [Anneissia japonica]